jgi:hypothetical protein
MVTSARVLADFHEDSHSFTAQADLITRDPDGKVIDTRTVDVEAVRLEAEPPELDTSTE